MKNLCCKEKEAIAYSIIHRPKPLPMNEDLTKAIEYLLWYVPNIASVQSEENPLVDNLLFDDFSFHVVLQSMDISKEDVLILEEIPEKMERFFKGKICTQCEKIILTLYDNETKTKALFRHMRNSIAHGSFTIVNTMMIAFDYKDSFEKSPCTAILKLHPQDLLRGLEVLNSEVTEENLAKIAFEKNGYMVRKNKAKNQKNTFDFLVTKNTLQYAVEIKKYPPSKYISLKDVKELVAKFEDIYKDLTPVVIINTSRLQKESKNLLRKKKVIILDSSNISKLLQGRDMLQEIEEA